MGAPRVPDEAARALVRDLEGREVALAELWRERPAVLLFVRHFGCLFCREQVAELSGKAGAIRARGAELVVIGCGNRHFAQGFKAQLQLEAPLYVDTTRASYRALGLRRMNPLELLRPSVLCNALRAWRAGRRQGRVQGDPWQLGGVLVVRPGGEVAFRHRSAVAGDHPPSADVLAALGDEAVSRKEAV